MSAPERTTDHRTVNRRGCSQPSEISPWPWYLHRFWSDHEDTCEIYRMRPHHRRSCLPSQAARPGADRVQDRRSNVQSFTRKCAAVSGTTCCCCRSARPADITLWWYQSSDGAICQTFNSRWPGVHGCCTACLEHSAGGDNDAADTLYLPSWLFRKSYPDIIIWTSSLLYTFYN